MSLQAYEITHHVISDSVTRLALKGEFDIRSVEDLRDALGRAIDEDHAAQLYVDLDQATFIDSENIRTLIWGYRTAHDAATQLRVINAHGIVRRVLQVTGVWQQIGSTDRDLYDR